MLNIDLIHTIEYVKNGTVESCILVEILSFGTDLDMCDLFNMLFCNDMLLFDFSGLEDSLFWRMIFHQPGHVFWL